MGQDVVTSVNTCGLLIRNKITFDRPAERTLYTLLDLGIWGHTYENPDTVHEAYVVQGPECDHAVAHDRERYLAVAQRRLSDDHQRFDDYRVSEQGICEEPRRSAWADIYEENDGYIDSNEYGRGDLDTGFGLYVDDTTHVEWLTAVEFCYGETPPVAHAMALLDRGYRSERCDFANAWEKWHAGVSHGPTDDSRANDPYEKPERSRNSICVIPGEESTGSRI